MMKKSNLLVLFLAIFATSSYAQLVNQGGTITIQPGATLIVQSDVTNTTGTITNNGTIQVEGDFTNNATVSSAAGSKVIFTGSTDSNFEGGEGTYAIVENDKTAGKVVLTENLSVTEAVDFSGGTSNIDLANFDIILSEVTTTNGTQATGWFETSGTGKVVKELTTAATTNFDVGDDTNYTPVSVDHSGTYGASSEVSARVTAMVHPNIPAEADAYISRYWTVENTGITSPSMAMTGTYVAGDVTGTESNVKGARYESSEWEYATAAQNGSTVSATSTASATDLSGTNFFGKADLTIFLEGAYSGGTMTTNIPVDLTSPYLDAPKTVASIPANVVDWIKIETRDAANSPETVTSAFLLNDGSIVGDDGMALPILKDASASSIVAIYHRNHLAIRTPSTLDLVATTNYNFSTGLGQAYDNSALSNDAMVDLGSGVYGLHRGNANNDANINVIDFLITKANTNVVQANVYSVFDLNMDGNVNIIDFLLAKSASTVIKVNHL